MNSSSLEDILSVISQTAIFITRFVYKAWIFCMNFMNSNYFWQSREFSGSFHTFQIPKIIILFQFYTNFRQTTAKNNSQSFLCKITDFQCSTILCCYPLMFLCEFMQRAEKMVSATATSAQQAPGRWAASRTQTGSLSSARSSVLGAQGCCTG